MLLERKVTRYDLVFQSLPQWLEYQEVISLPQYAVEMEKKKVSVTIDQDLIDWVDQEIANRRFSNRSHAMCFAIYKLQNDTH